MHKKEEGERGFTRGEKTHMSAEQVASTRAPFTREENLTPFDCPEAEEKGEFLYPLGVCFHQKNTFVMYCSCSDITSIHVSLNCM